MNQSKNLVWKKKNNQIKNNQIKDTDLKQEIINDLVKMNEKGYNIECNVRTQHGQVVRLKEYDVDIKCLYFVYLIKDLFKNKNSKKSIALPESITHEQAFETFFKYINIHRYCFECGEIQYYPTFDSDKDICLHCRIKYLAAEEDKQFDKSKINCVICQTECYQHYDYKLTNCNHVFHKRCIAKTNWSVRTTDDGDHEHIVNCPLCRKMWYNISYETIHAEDRLEELVKCPCDHVKDDDVEE